MHLEPEPSTLQSGATCMSPCCLHLQSSAHALALCPDGSLSLPTPVTSETCTFFFNSQVSLRHNSPHWARHLPSVLLDGFPSCQVLTFTPERVLDLCTFLSVSNFQPVFLLQEFLKHTTPNYLVRGTDLFSLRPGGLARVRGLLGTGPHIRR